MDDDARPHDVVSVGGLDRWLLELVRAGHSTAGAGEKVGLTLAATALRLQALRRRLGVASTAAAIDLVCGADPRHDHPDGRSGSSTRPQDDPPRGSPSGQ